jgi:hypothetical protein
VAKQFATGGLNLVLGCTRLTLAPTKQTSTICLGEITPTQPSTRQDTKVKCAEELAEEEST